MPYCVVSHGDPAAGGEGDVRIFYQRYGHGGTKVLLIIGFAGTHESWGPQVKGLTGAVEPVDEESPAGDDAGGAADEGVEVCCFDNRGMGRSSVPPHKSHYTTVIMAKDALALMDHLGWRKAHLFGHSMGSMIASKLAAIAPERVASLALLNTTGGGYQCIPKIDWQTISLACRFLRARTPEQRAVVDLDVHYTREFLDEIVGSNTRRQMLYQEYVKGLSSCGMQSRHGFEGQLNACWTHKLTQKELDRIRSAGFLILIIHGRDDVVAQLHHARRLAEKLQPAAKLVELHGGHLVSHERSAEVNMSLMEMIKASKSNTDQEEWSNLPKKSNDQLLAGSDNRVARRECNIIVLYNLQLILLFLFGAFYIILEHARRVLRVLKPVRVSATSL
ncbi:putative aminoacrylate hydrolase RutD [Oryza brachyantha]|uniref:AB hydrolase-1 domain-containing protein n=1 Tax=Oryza brachyantha TaxID=4533 RepID=J3LC07_ORYBR|nr:putative aminoacrylate hydrolase RutD [Oryza brachyantha]